tara:strand:+ start:24246 stop:25874 length:1629 start_codon:yes stop_codon:yes gene_type:complete
MLPPEEQEEMLQLCWEYQYGTLSHKDAARLERLVLNNDAARDFFIRYSSMCANLEWEGVVDPGPLGRTTDYEPLPSGELNSLPHHLPVFTEYPPRRKTLFAALAFSLAFVATVSLLYFQPWRVQQPGFLARFSQTQNAVWVEGTRSWNAEDLIQFGDQIHLSSGIVELETASGARMILKGKSRLMLVNTDQFQLDEGNLFANVPPQAQGLSVETPTSRIVDLGTRFGLIVNPSQETEVHVLKGIVEFHLLNSKRETTMTKNLFEKDAVRVQPDSSVITKIEATPECFVQSLNVETPVLIAHWKLTESEKSLMAQDHSGNQLNLQLIEEKGRSPFTGRQAPHNTATAAGPFASQFHKLYRRLSEAETPLFNMQRFTIELWARNPNRDRQGDSDTLLHYRNVEQHSTSQFNLFSDDHSGQLGFGFLNTKDKYVSHRTSKTIPWQKDRWYHIVFTYDSHTPAAHDSIVTYSRTPEFASAPDFQQTLTQIEDITPLVPGGILAIGGSTLTDIPRHWGGDIADVRFINGIPDRHDITHSHSKQALNH